jgi:hypothetical protein
MHSRKHFIRGFVTLGFVFALVFAVEFFVEWWRLGQPGMDAMSWATKNNTKLVDILSPMARAYNNILAMLLATVGLAIPLTANMHTPKLIEMFLRDRTNQVMLVLCAFGAANVLFVAHLIGPSFAPMWVYRLTVAGALFGWAALIPYFFYVVRFLDPSNIIRRLRDEVHQNVDAGVAGADAEVCQDVIHERLEQIGTIVIKSIGRADRGVALEGVWALKQILDHYREVKPRLPTPWFLVDRKDFVGLSVEAIEIINEDRVWLEHKVMHQMFLAYQGALSHSEDAVSAISDASRVIAKATADRKDEPALALMIRYFNSFIREGIKRRDTRAIYDIFYQYRLLAKDCGDERPEMLRQIARHFRYYGDQAAMAGQPFIQQFAAFDLGWLTRRVFETKSAAANDLLGEVLAIDHRKQGEPLGLVVKAKLVLGGFFLESDHADAAARVRRNLTDVEPGTLQRIGEELMDVPDRCFWEVTDRQVNFEWMAEGRRDKIRAFVASLAVQGS